MSLVRRLRRRPRLRRPVPAGGVGAATSAAGRTARPPAVDGPQRFRRRRRRRWVVPAAAVLALALVGGAGWVLGWSSLLAVHGVRVDGRTAAVRDEVLAAVQAGGAAADGIPLARVDTDRVAAAAAGVTAVDRVEVTRAWPHTVLVRVVERTARAALKTPYGYRLIDAEGVAYATVRARPRSLPLLSAADGPAGEDARAAAVNAVRSLPRRLASQVGVVRASSPDDIEFSVGDGVTVVWGDAERSARKAEVLTALMARRARVYDVSAPDLPTLRGAVPPS